MDGVGCLPVWYCYAPCAGRTRERKLTQRVQGLHLLRSQRSCENMTEKGKNTLSSFQRLSDLLKGTMVVDAIRMLTSHHLFMRDLGFEPATLQFSVSLCFCPKQPYHW